jgi:serine phosphatase RsbU (regulator of sigma subunit)
LVRRWAGAIIAAMQDQSNHLQLELLIGVAKVSKYATTESGDTFEMTERPHGGLSLVLADGQRSGRAAKIISNLVARKAIALLGEGVRDGAAARAAHDYLRTHREGKVSSELIIISLDLVSRTLVVSRNSHCPVLIAGKDGLRSLDEHSEAIGLYERTKPVITELPATADTWIVAFTDGVLEAGEGSGTKFGVGALVTELLARGEGNAGALADAILGRATELDQERPHDDMSVMVLSVVPARTTDLTRRLTACFPLPGH